jgi:hypothetical protein
MDKKVNNVAFLPFHQHIFSLPPIAQFSRAYTINKITMMGILAMSANIKLEWDWIAVADSLAYFDTVAITAVKKLYVFVRSN